MATGRREEGQRKRAEARERRRKQASDERNEQAGASPPADGDSPADEPLAAVKQAAKVAAAGAAVGAAAAAARALSKHEEDEEERPDEAVGEVGEPEAQADEPEHEREPRQEREPEPTGDPQAGPEPRPATREESRPQPRARQTDERTAPPQDDRPSGVSRNEAREVVARAREQLETLVGRSPESVSAMERTHDGWLVTVEVVEVSRIPESTDVLVSYEIELDDDRNMRRYARVRRYYRSQADQGGGQ
jgi:Gas vesicle synthesis protein GvpO